MKIELRPQTKRLNVFILHYFIAPKYFSINKIATKTVPGAIIPRQHRTIAMKMTSNANVMRLIDSKMYAKIFRLHIFIV